jgi:3-deoxy-7-phosphoheptulonate synthase
MKSKIEDIHIESAKPLLSPAFLKHDMPSSDLIASHVLDVRNQVSNVLHQRDKRLMVVVGPCSIHDPKACLDYARRLQKLKLKVSDSLLVLMRVYFEKPRTTVGWKGLINDPHLDNSCDINAGISLARSLLLQINDLNLGVATEFLDTITPQYIADLVSWAAIGARTTESQVHRNLSSGLSMPVGFKNSTTGNVQIAVDAVVAANNPHHFLSVTENGLAAIVQTQGNPNSHIILRGGSRLGPNYDQGYVEAALALLHEKKRLPSIMVDCSHANSQKDPANQSVVLEAIGEQIAGGASHLSGVMIESFIESGNQPLGSIDSLDYGVSITDACISWSETELLLTNLADQVKRWRQL